MIRTLIVADSGEVMAHLTGALAGRFDIDIVAYASGRSPVAATVRKCAPDVVLVDEMSWAGLALARMAEVREAAPEAIATIVPRHLEPAALALVLDEVLASPSPVALAATHRRAA